ncbi:MAG: hypothetical protein IT209_02050 [Armatimonadetes bacterium]|nr:hypothetical protein [Armatimonadota bacterium]
MLTSEQNAQDVAQTLEPINPIEVATQAQMDEPLWLTKALTSYDNAMNGMRRDLLIGPLSTDILTVLGKKSVTRTSE